MVESVIRHQYFLVIRVPAFIEISFPLFFDCGDVFVFNVFISTFLWVINDSFHHLYFCFHLCYPTFLLLCHCPFQNYFYHIFYGLFLHHFYFCVVSVFILFFILTPMRERKLSLDLIHLFSLGLLTQAFHPFIFPPMEDFRDWKELLWP